MKTKRYLGLLLFGIYLGANDQIYQGCGINESEARLNLANNISVKIESSTFLKKENNSWFGLSSYSKTFTKSTKQTTNLALKDITITKKDNQVCATIKKDKLFELTKALITKIKKYNKSILPTYEKDKIVAINSILSDIKNGLVLAEVYQQKLPKDTIQQLQKKQKLFVNLREKYHAQFAKIVVVGKYDRFEIDNKSYDTNKEIFLKQGKHKYTIISKGHCKIEKNFTLQKNQDYEEVINLNDYNLPYILITSNKQDAQLKIDNKDYQLGKKYIANRCDNTQIPFAITFEDQKENGTLTLQPNNYIQKDFVFYSHKELKEFANLSQSYAKASRVEIKYNYIIVDANKDYEDYENLQGVELNYINSKSFLRYGYGLLYAQGTQNLQKQSKAYELYYNLGIQLFEIGANNSALHIGSVVMIPKLTAKVGVGYHELLNLKTNQLVDSFDGEDDSISWQNNGILKATFGIDFLVNKHLGINIFAQKQFTMEESYSIGAGVSFGF
jgi:hypothetical protein